MLSLLSGKEFEVRLSKVRLSSYPVCCLSSRAENLSFAFLVSPRVGHDHGDLLVEDPPVQGLVKHPARIGHQNLKNKMNE
jgi:hypothetical protein